MSALIIASQDEKAFSGKARHFCAQFCAPGAQPTFVFGRNVYAESIARHIDISGFVDDYTKDVTYLGRPVLRSADLPSNALVLIASGGRPFTAKRRLDSLGIENLDYFAFYRFSGLPLTPVVFNEGFAEDFQSHATEYEWIHDRLHDAPSCEIFKKLVSFRLSYDLDLLAGFSAREDVQYFEEFLHLEGQGETFIDIGGYDGYTSLEFIRRCPGYRAVHLFEPEPGNYDICVNRLSAYANVRCHPTGLSNVKKTLKLAPMGSGSKLSEQGSIEIPVDRLDDVLHGQGVPTFIKMDIEGAELPAIEGAQQMISTHHPRLALSVYHNAGDFWRIPQKVLAIRDDYDIYLRHYTESIYETVMFFMPRA